MQQEKTFTYSHQTVAMDDGSLMVLDVLAHPTEAREGFITLPDGRRGLVIQAYPSFSPLLSHQWFLYRWLNQS
jgi:hypothetical protein